MTENEKHDETRPLSFYDEPAPDETAPDETASDETTREETTPDQTTRLETDVEEAAPEDRGAVAEAAYDEPTRRTHPLSVGYLVCGLVFLGIAASWALRQAGVIESDSQPWVLPLVLVVAGAAGLLALLAKGMTGRKA